MIRGISHGPVSVRLSLCLSVTSRCSTTPVLDCGTTFHLDYGGRELPSTPSDNLWKLIYLATEALSDSF